MRAPVSTSPAREAAVLLVGKVLGTLSEALVPLVIVRLWGKADVGVVASAQLTYAAISTILQAGFPEAATFYLPGRPGPERRAIAGVVAKTLFGVGGLTALVLLALTGAAALFGSQSGWAEGATLLPYFAALALVDLPSRMATNVLVAEGRAGTTAGLGVLRALGASAATLVPAVAGASALEVVVSTCAFGFVFGLGTLAVLARHYAREARAPSPISAREVVRFSVPFGLTEIASIANAQLDRYLVLWWFAAATFADYQAGAWQVPMIGAIPHIISVAYTPRFVVWFREGRRADVLESWRRLAARTALLVTPLSAIFVVGAEETMRLLFTDAYGGSASVFRLFSIFMMLRVTPYGNLLLAAGRPDLITRASFLAVLSNAALTIPCIALIGLDGAALGTLLAFLPTAAYYCFGIAEVMGTRFREVYPLGAHLRVLALVAVSALPAIAVKIWLPVGPGVALLLEAAALLVTFAALGTAAGLVERGDWATVRSWVSARVRRGSPAT